MQCQTVRALAKRLYRAMKLQFSKTVG